MALELIYFKACPFAQRTLIALEQLGLEFKKTLINPMDKPAWIFEFAPLGQIPLLRVAGQSVLFDSSVICEYLNDSSSGDLLPEAALERGRYRSIIAFAGDCQMNFGGLIAASDETMFNQQRDALLKKLGWIEGLLGSDGPLFAGEKFTMLDAAFAPLFLRMQHLQAVVPFYAPEDLPKITRWSQALLAQEAVQKSVDGDFSMIFKNVVRGRGKGGFVDSKLG